MKRIELSLTSIVLAVMTAGIGLTAEGQSVARPVPVAPVPASPVPIFPGSILADSVFRQLEEAHRASRLAADSLWRIQREIAAAQAEILKAQRTGIQRALAGVGQTDPSIPQLATWGDQDQADSLFLVALNTLNRGDWAEAAVLFNSVQKKYPDSRRRMQAAYYEAFANYRIGSRSSLLTASRILSGFGEQTVGLTKAEVLNLEARVRGALAAKGDVDAAAELRKMVQLDNVGTGTIQNRTSCDDDDVQLRIMALSALVGSDREAAAPSLMRVVGRSDRCTATLRAYAWGMLRQYPSTEATKLASSVAKDSGRDIHERTAALSYLSSTGGETGSDVLEEIIRTDKDGGVRQVALSALAREDSDRARKIIREIAMDGSVDETLRLAAISVLTRSPGDENTRLLMGLLTSPTTTASVRMAVATRLAPDTSIPIGEWVRIYQVQAASEVRMAVIRVFGIRSEEAATDQLIRIVEGEKDPALRGLAIRALGSKKSERARMALQKIVDR